MDILRKFYSVAIDLVETLVIAGAIFVVIYAFLFRPFQVNGQSMYPNYHDGEYILTNLIALRLGSINRGDVIVFQAPPDPEKDYIKRVIGLPGDQIEVKNGGVLVNGKVLNESDYLASDVLSSQGSYLTEGKTITVPQGNYFVMGDNRPESSDSRAWGFVPKDKIIGESFFVYWPVTRMRLVKRGKYGAN